MSEDYLADVAGGKTGAELFRELMRLYSEAQLEDYFKMGVWNDRQMRTDYVLIEAHRREAGAPAPPPLDSIPHPKVPEPKMLHFGAGQHGLGPALMQFVANGLPAKAAAVNPATELRNVAVFISKNKLDPTKAKGMLMGLSVEDRRAVMDGFSSEKIGLDATEDLQQYITKHAKSGQTGLGSGKMVSGLQANGTPPAGGFNGEELKLAALFIAKNKLEPSRAKMLLMGLLPAQRRSVMESFTTTASGQEATEALEQYIAECKEAGFSEEPASKKARVSSAAA